MRSAKDRSRFGHGDVRGIAAAEGANNATAIADLVPTMLFSVPGGPAAAIFLGALYIYGYYPGPRFVVDHADVMFLVIWSCAIGSVGGAIGRRPTPRPTAACRRSFDRPHKARADLATDK